MIRYISKWVSLFVRVYHAYGSLCTVCTACTETRVY